MHKGPCIDLKDKFSFNTKIHLASVVRKPTFLILSYLSLVQNIFLGQYESRIEFLVVNPALKYYLHLKHLITAKVMDFCSP